MPTTKSLSVRDLDLDLSNYRTVPQPDEIHAVHAMVSIGPDYFWALMRSIIEDGYLPTENIIVLDQGTNPKSLLVKEGNRRVGVLKLLLGILPLDGLNIPADLLADIANITPEWKAQNESVPCTIFSIDEAVTADRIVARTHGKGDKEGRNAWNAVARARHKRDTTGKGEPALDLLEKYLVDGQNITAQQKERWAGVYPLTVLDEAMKALAKRFGVKNAPDLAHQYPAIPYREALEDILLRIGRQDIGFPEVRDKDTDFAASSGLPPISAPAQPIGTTPASQTVGGTPSGETGSPQGAASAGAGQTPATSGSGSTSSATAGVSGLNGNGTTTKGKQPKALAIQDPKTVKRLLKQFQPVGNKRAKVVTLRNEARDLNLETNPIAFCFILRSMFELSAKLFFEDHGLSLKKSNGKDKTLAELLQEVTNHLTNNMQDHAMKKTLFGAMTELGKQDGVLSVTSMNQLVHNPSYSITSGDVCVLFGNVFPLLDAMNK